MASVSFDTLGRPRRGRHLRCAGDDRGTSSAAVIGGQGIAGIILATPDLVALRVIAENSDSGKPMMEFLGHNDQKPARDERLRQL